MKKNLKYFIQQLKNIKKKGSFAQNISIVFSGNVVNFGLQLIFAPIMSRIFGPEAFGEYAFYNLIVSNIVFTSALSLPSVYILPKDEYSFLSLSKIVFFSTVSLTIITLLCYNFINTLNSHFLEWYIILGLCVLIILNSLNAILSASNTRKKKFSINTSINVASNFLSKSAILGAGYTITTSGIGLLLGDCIRSMVVFIGQTNLKTKLVVFRFMISNNWKSVIIIFKKNTNVPKYIYSAQLVNKYTSDLPILFIGSYFGTKELGFYVFAISMLNLPINIATNSIRSVYFQKANELFLKGQIRFEVFFEKILKLSLFPIIIFGTIFLFFSENLFAFVFGENWSIAGTIASIIGIQYILLTLTTPFGGTRRILKKEKQILKLTIISLFFKCAPLLLLLIEIDLLLFAYILSISNSIFILYNYLDLIRIAIPTNKNKNIYSYGLTALTVIGYILVYFAHLHNFH